ncbi:hypothetical protein [Ochrovirga pacifica]|uniref:hypothetical protein n=1 Tax=Ochrovirga pacifica TaxID=1042376 RepID=UPI000255A050|nr:hypothetical protein [Ochrovirga pacifica]
MKKLLLSTLLLTSLIGFSQEKEFKSPIKKGVINLEGNLAFGKSNSSSVYTDLESKATNFRINPNVGFVVQDNFVVGVSLGYSYLKNTSDSSLSTSSLKRHSYSGGLFATQFYDITEKFKFNLTGQAIYNRTTFSSNRDQKGNGVNIGFSPGFTYFLGNQIALKFNYGSLSYNYFENIEQDRVVNKSHNIGLDLSSSQVTFGLSYFL